jgi:flagellar biosynthesis regulator FlbT
MPHGTKLPRGGSFSCVPQDEVLARIAQVTDVVFSKRVVDALIRIRRLKRDWVD